MLLFFAFTLASLSFVAAIAAIWSCVRVRKLLGAASMRSLGQLSTEVAELTSCFESLSSQQRKLAARVGMREVRERRAEAPIDANPGDERATRLVKLREVARSKGFRL